MSRRYTALYRYLTHRDRHQTRQVLRNLMSDDSALFPDLELGPKKPRKPVTGLLNFPATYDPKPAEVGPVSGPIFNPILPPADGPDNDR